jgi:hypothetical protein
MSIYEQFLTLPEIKQDLRAELFQPPLAILGEHDNTFFTTLVAILQQGQQRGEVRTDISVDRLSRYMLALYVSCLLAELKGSATGSYVDEIDTLLAFLQVALKE